VLPAKSTKAAIPASMINLVIRVFIILLLALSRVLILPVVPSDLRVNVVA
jgi:hypothetical protein